jgi:hypothetical protein
MANSRAARIGFPGRPGYTLLREVRLFSARGV